MMDAALKKFPPSVISNMVSVENVFPPEGSDQTCENRCEKWTSVFKKSRSCVKTIVNEELHIS